MMTDKKPDEKDVEAAKKQAALDKEAADLAAKLAAEQAEADKLAADAQKAAERAEDFGAPRAARCPEPDCRERLERYTGGDINPHKVGTHWCPRHGRMRLA
jgi:hypothetical protein